MTGLLKRTDVICGFCGKEFSIQSSELKRRLRESKERLVFCSQRCFILQKRLNCNQEVYWLFHWLEHSTKSTIGGFFKNKEGSCCEILQTHADLLRNDPNRLSTEFIKSLSKCECERFVE